MKRFLLVLMVTLFSALLIAPEADARRMGGGGNVGRQSSITQRQATPPAAATAPAAGAGAAAAQGGARKGMGMLGGIAAGLGLAALASWLGFGEGFANLLLMLLVGMVALVAFRMFMARRNGALAGAGGPGSMPPQGAMQPGMQRQSAASSWQGPQAAAGGAAGSAAAAAQAAALIPADFDAEAFVRNAKVMFVRLQAAFDRKNLDDLREFTSPEMFSELKVEILQRSDGEQTTDVVKLDGELLGVERDPAVEMATVQFSGMLRETADGAAEPFKELWNFTRPSNGAMGWVLAGIQQLR